MPFFFFWPHILLGIIFLIKQEHLILDELLTSWFSSMTKQIVATALLISHNCEVSNTGVTCKHTSKLTKCYKSMVILLLYLLKHKDSDIYFSFSL
jgi:hypothetical protein